MPPLVLSSSYPDGEGLVRLRFDRPAPGHAHAGQYVTLELTPGLKGTFALASRPGAPAELLIKRGGAAAEHLAARTPGEALPFPDARGPGWGVPADADRLVMLVNGSGIAAVRPLIQEQLDRPTPPRMHLLFGVMSPAHVPFLAEVHAWADAGVEVTWVYDGAPVRFVQHAAASLGLLTPGATLILCGHPPMIEEARAMWAAAGGDPAAARVNY